MTIGSGAGWNAGEPGSRPDGERETTSRRSRQPILAVSEARYAADQHF